MKRNWLVTSLRLPNCTIIQEFYDYFFFNESDEKRVNWDLPAKVKEGRLELGTKKREVRSAASSVGQAITRPMQGPVWGNCLKWTVFHKHFNIHLDFAICTSRWYSPHKKGAPQLFYYVWTSLSCEGSVIRVVNPGCTNNFIIYFFIIVYKVSHYIEDLSC